MYVSFSTNISPCESVNVQPKTQMGRRFSPPGLGSFCNWLKLNRADATWCSNFSGLTMHASRMINRAAENISFVRLLAPLIEKQSIRPLAPLPWLPKREHFSKHPGADKSHSGKYLWTTIFLHAAAAGCEQRAGSHIGNQHVQGFVFLKCVCQICLKCCQSLADRKCCWISSS